METLLHMSVIARVDCTGSIEAEKVSGESVCFVINYIYPTNYMDHDS